MRLTTFVAGTLTGIIVGGGGAAVAATQFDYKADGFTVKCQDNGAGRHRRCDINVNDPTNRVDIRVNTENSEWLAGVDLTIWGLNPNPNKHFDNPLAPRFRAERR